LHIFTITGSYTEARHPYPAIYKTNKKIHTDLKPENLLFRTPENHAELLIADFGLSRIIDEEQFHVLTTTCGTPGYMAPEIFKKTGHGKPVYHPTLLLFPPYFA
jgi:serine/threonine protein kinase